MEEGKRNWRVLGGEREVLLEGNIEKGEEEDGRVAEEDVANVSIIDQTVCSSQTEQTTIPFPQLFIILFYNTTNIVTVTPQNI